MVRADVDVVRCDERYVQVLLRVGLAVAHVEREVVALVLGRSSQVPNQSPQASPDCLPLQTLVDLDRILLQEPATHHQLGSRRSH